MGDPQLAVVGKAVGRVGKAQLRHVRRARSRGADEALPAVVGAQDRRAGRPSMVPRPSSHHVPALIAVNDWAPNPGGTRPDRGLDVARRGRACRSLAAQGRRGLGVVGGVVAGSRLMRGRGRCRGGMAWGGLVVGPQSEHEEPDNHDDGHEQRRDDHQRVAASPPAKKSPCPPIQLGRRRPPRRARCSRSSSRWPPWRCGSRMSVGPLPRSTPRAVSWASCVPTSSR